MRQVADIADQPGQARRFALEVDEQARRIVRGEALGMREGLGDPEHRRGRRGELVREIGEQPAALVIGILQARGQLVERARHRAEHVAHDLHLAEERIGQVGLEVAGGDPLVGLRDDPRAHADDDLGEQVAREHAARQRDADRQDRVDPADWAAQPDPLREAREQREARRGRQRLARDRPPWLPHATSKR